MVEYLAYDVEGLFAELKERARAEGAYTKEEWDDLVEEVLDEHLRVGEFDEDEDLTELREALEARFADFESEIR